MFDTIWIARVVPSRANTSQALIDTGKPCDAIDADFSVLHIRSVKRLKKKKTINLPSKREICEWVTFKDLIKTVLFPFV